MKVRFALAAVSLVVAACSSDRRYLGQGGGDEGGGSSNGPSTSTGPSLPTTRIALGSCVQQNKPKPVLSLAADSRPDYFLFLGDNVYGDTEDMAVLQSKYDQLGASPEFQELRAAAPIFAVWDDHDYGRNDAGKEYPRKAESKQIFLDFWGESASSTRRVHDGNYHAERIVLPEGTIELILLDTRWFRDPLDPTTDTTQYKNDYQPTTDTTRTMLGAEQWAWLEETLKEPADLRIIATSTQFGHAYNGWESWTNLPHERQRLIDLVDSTGASGVVFVSGDVHWGELSRETSGPYPLYDLTSSGITETWYAIDDNDNRVGEPVAENNYGALDIAWDGPATTITFSLVDVTGATRVSETVSLASLAAP